MPAPKREALGDLRDALDEFPGFLPGTTPHACAANLMKFVDTKKLDQGDSLVKGFFISTEDSNNENKIMGVHVYKAGLNEITFDPKRAKDTTVVNDYKVTAISAAKDEKAARSILVKAITMDQTDAKLMLYENPSWSRPNPKVGVDDDREFLMQKLGINRGLFEIIKGVVGHPDYSDSNGIVDLKALHTDLVPVLNQLKRVAGFMTDTKTTPQEIINTLAISQYCARPSKVKDEASALSWISEECKNGLETVAVSQGLSPDLIRKVPITIIYMNLETDNLWEVTVDVKGGTGKVKTKAKPFAGGVLKGMATAKLQQGLLNKSCDLALFKTGVPTDKVKKLMVCPHCASCAVTTWKAAAAEMAEGDTTINRGLQGATIDAALQARYSGFPEVTAAVNAARQVLQTNLIISEEDARLVTPDQWDQMGIPIGMRNFLSGGDCRGGSI